jgi:membrane protease YdiL (CAAX protease family)
MKKNLFLTVLLISGFLISYFLDDILFSFNPDWSLWLPESPILWHITWLVLRLVPVAVVSFVILGKDTLNGLGINARFPKAFLFALLSTAPLFLGFVLFAEFSHETTFLKIFSNCISPGFYEELLVRSFLIGLLFRRFKWGFIPASLVGALFFGAWHIYQGSDWISSFFAFLVTALGSVWFGWLYIEWRYNVWFNVCLHVLMNLSWLMFNIEGGAAGNITANIFRAVTIVISIIVTLKIFSQKTGFIINKKTLWLNRTQQ